MSPNPHAITREFERAVCEYTGAPYCVTTNSCTMAILLAVAWRVQGHVCGMIEQSGDPEHQFKYSIPPKIEIPRRTYASVPQSIIRAGGQPTYRDENWSGAYQLKPLPVWDSARWFTSGLYRKVVKDAGGFVCLSFHATKTLGDSQGGAILHDSADADAWFRRARFDGRTEGVAPKDDRFNMIGWHCYLSPDVAARLLWKLAALPKHNAPLPNDDYPDLSQFEVFHHGR